MTTSAHPTLILADDEPVQRKTLRRILEKSDWRGRDAEDGSEVLALVRAKMPDAVLMDWWMPGMSGLDTLKKLKSDPATSMLPVILYSGLRQGMEDEVLALHSGADLFLLRTELLEKCNGVPCVTRYLDLLRKGQVPAIKNVVVIEDDIEHQDFMKECLEGHGAAVYCASSAKAGLTLVREFNPGLILLDLYLNSELNGPQLLQVFRQEESAKNAAIFVMTGMPVGDGILQSAILAAGASGFLSKPFSESQLRLQLCRAALTKPFMRFGGSRILERGRIRVEVDARRVWVGGNLLKPLAGRRFELLCLLLRNKTGLDREAILERVWGVKRPAPKIVEMAVHRLRADIGDAQGRMIVSIPGGYRLVG